MSFIETLDPIKRCGHLIPLQDYQLLRSLIVQVLTQEGSCSIVQLLDAISGNSIVSNVKNLNWVLMVVKSDLEARKIIKRNNKRVGNSSLKSNSFPEYTLQRLAK